MIKKAFDYIKKSPINSITYILIAIAALLVISTSIGTLCIIALQQLYIKENTDDANKSNRLRNILLFLSIANPILYLLSSLHPALLILKGLTLTASIILYTYKIFEPHAYEPSKNLSFDQTGAICTSLILMNHLPYISIFPRVIHLFMSDFTMNILIIGSSVFTYLSKHANIVTNFITKLFQIPQVQEYIINQGKNIPFDMRAPAVPPQQPIDADMPTPGSKNRQTQPNNF